MHNARRATVLDLSARFFLGYLFAPAVLRGVTGRELTRLRAGLKPLPACSKPISRNRTIFELKGCAR